MIDGDGDGDDTSIESINGVTYPVDSVQSR